MPDLLPTYSAQELLNLGYQPEPLPQTIAEQQSAAASGNTFWVDDEGNFWGGTFGGIVTGGVDLAGQLAYLFGGGPSPVPTTLNAPRDNTAQILAALAEDERKRKNNNALYIGLGIGGALLLLIIILMLNRK